MTKLTVRNITVLGALNSDVHDKLPFLLGSSLADVPVAWRSHFVFGLFSARLHEAPCSWQLLFFFAPSRSRLIGCAEPSQKKKLRFKVSSQNRVQQRFVEQIIFMVSFQDKV